GTVHHYQIERAQSTGAGFALISSNVAVAAFSDTSVNSGTSYVYRVCAVDAAGNHSAYSNVDLATAISFTDEPLTPGTTTIRAQHISELRQAISAVRTLAGLSAVTWTDPSLSGVTIKAVHIQEMRISLDEALSSLGLPASSYTDSSLTGIAVKKVHVDELRQRVR